MGGQSINVDTISALLGEGSYSWVYSLRCGQSVVKIAKCSRDSLEEQYNIMLRVWQSNPSLFVAVKQAGSLQIDSPAQRQKISLSYFTLQKKGVSLTELLTLRGKLKVSTIIHISRSLITQLEHLSKLQIVHNDIKPSNILFGTGQQRSKIFLIDFGMAEDMNKLKKSKDGYFRGNIPFSSTRRLRGGSSNHFDDIESMIYLTIWMLMDGSLPWMHLEGEKSPHEAIQQTLYQRRQFVNQFKINKAQSPDKRHQLIAKLALISELFEGSFSSKTAQLQLLHELKSYFQ